MTRRLLAALLVLAALLPGGARAQLSSATQEILPLGQAGGEPMSSTNHRMTSAGVDDGVAAGSAASANQNAAPGLMHVIARPLAVTGLADRGDVTVSSVTLQWSAPGADGELGSLQTGSRYLIRVASYTSPDTFAYDHQDTLPISTSGVSAGQTVQEGFTGLLINTTYFVQLWTRDPVGNISESSPRSTFTTLAPAPVHHAGGPFLEVWGSSAVVRWHYQPQASGYKLEASSFNFAPGQGVIESSVTWNNLASTLTVFGLQSASTYYFRVASLNWIGLSSYTVLGSTRTRLDAQRPLTLVSTYTAISSYSATVAWDDPGNPASTVYTLESSTASDFTGSLISSTTYNTSLEMLGLFNNTTYHFRVKAASDTETTGYLVFLPTSTLAAPPLEAPPSLRSLDSVSANWTWDPNAAVSGTTWTVTVNGVDYSTRSPSFTLAGLTPNTTYAASVLAFNHNGVLTAPLDLGTTVSLAAQPAAVAVPVVTLSSVAARVAFDAGANPPGITTFSVVLTAEDPFPNSNPFNASVSTFGSPVDFAGLQPNTTYWYHAAAKNHQQVETAYAAFGSTATSAALPSGGTFSDVQVGSVTISWDAQNAQGFRVLASSTGFAAGTLIVQTTTPVDGATSLVVDGLEPNTTQFIRLAAYNWQNHPTETTVTELATLALQPSNTMFFMVAETSVTVNWKRFPSSPSSATAQGYVVEASTSPDFSPIFASTSINTPVQSTLTVTGLEPGVDYWVRAGALNWNSVPHYQSGSSTRTKVTPVTWDGGGGNNLWHTAANWNPDGVPTSGSPVTIAANVSVFVPATAAPISFSSITLGNPAGTVSSGLIIATAVARGGSILIYKNSGLTQATTRQLFLDGDFTMQRGSSLTHTTFATTVSSVNIKITGLFDVQAGATIAVSTYGWAGGAANGGAGAGPGGGQSDTASSAGGTGGGHGGAGGDSNGGASPAPGVAYDSLTFPIYAGSGGGGGDGAGSAGGRGGGVVVLEAAQFILNGFIEASGTKGANSAGTANVGAGGGGSGGTINIKTGTLQGGGTVQADGGPGGSDTGGGDDPAGGGAGGRVAIEVTGSGKVCDLSISVAGGAAGTGGTTATPGANGTTSSTITLPVPTLSAVWSTSDTIHWTWTQASGITNFRLYAEGGTPVTSLLTPDVTFYTETPLLPNTTYTRYIQVSACGSSSDTVSVPYATLASTIAALAQSFPVVDEAFLSAAWAALPSAPEHKSSEGYRLEVSSRADFNGLTHSSQTLNVAASTLSVVGLQRDTTYYARVASLNHAGELGPWLSLGSTSTLALPPSFPAGLFAVTYGSVTVTWNAATAQGWLVQASTTDFGALTPGGQVYSTMTFNGLSTQLTLDTPLEMCVDHYFRVASLNWSGAPNFAAPGSTSATLDYAVVVSTRDLDIGGVDVNTELVISTSFVLSNPYCPVTYAVKAATINAGSPWTISASSGTDTFTMQALFNASQPSSAAFEDDDKLSDAPALSTGARFSSGQSGVSVPHAASRTLWLKLGMPRITSASDPQQIRVTVTANPP